MPKKKKSSRKPPTPRTRLSQSPNPNNSMPNSEPFRNPNSISITDPNQVPTQNPISIEQNNVPNIDIFQNPITNQPKADVLLQYERRVKSPSPTPISIEENEDKAEMPISIEDEKNQEEVFIENEMAQEVENVQNVENDEKDGNFGGEFVVEETEGEEEKEMEQEEQGEEEGINFYSPLSVTNVEEHNNVVFGLMLDNNNNVPIIAPNVTTRKNTKRKRAMNCKQRAAFEKRLSIVKQNFKPIPFVPEKKLEFWKHEEILKRLGLWDFVNMEFDKEIRSDLLELLIANYNRSSHFSTVNDFRIKLSRADLGRALKLPGKKEKSISLETSDFEPERVSEESRFFIEELLSNWILLHDEPWIVPKEIKSFTELIRNGQLQKVDWAGLIWYMVDKELQAQEGGECYYASHIQCLMKSQREELFKEPPRLQVPVVEEDDAVDLKMGSAEDCQHQELEKQQIELSLGQNMNVDEQQYREEDSMDYQECKQEPGSPAPWFLNEKGHMTDHCLRRCNLNEVQKLESQDVMKEEEEGQDFDPQSKGTAIGDFSSTDLLQAIGTTNITYSPSFHLPDHSSGFFPSRIDTHMDPGGTSLFDNAYKRELSHDNVAGHSLNDHQKRMRTDVPVQDFYLYMQQISTLVGKAQACYQEKEQACLNAGMNEGIVLSELQQQNEDLSYNLQKTRYELQTRESDNDKLEHELVMMSSLLEGYRRALKETRRVFAEYRERNPEPEEPLYMDVSGSGGIVLSTREFERQRFEQEEQEKMQRCLSDQMIKPMESDWLEKFGIKQFEFNCQEQFDSFVEHVNCLDKKLIEFEENVKHLKEISAKGKIEET
ncbi:hypothetical protein IFM89_022641 [Coptis chinensis]|uniref:Uncharacterized protein n=1 Tax=Coptis chinensis TaxID=261450 RepID=A0A835LEW8_9MAGN|nr:hypothetical protein IFM89_022641 [Coptis chinensis]